MNDATAERFYSPVTCSRCALPFPSVPVSESESDDPWLCEPCRGALFAAARSS